VLFPDNKSDQQKIEFYEKEMIQLNNKCFGSDYDKLPQTNGFWIIGKINNKLVTFLMVNFYFSISF
jgi:hypothetical protein